MLPLLSLTLACKQADDPLHVVILVVDGARIDETVADFDSDLTGEPARAGWPKIWDELISQGTLVLPGYNMGTTITAPAHTNLATGVRTPLANMSVDDGPQLYRPDRPTLGEELKRQDPAADSLLLANADLVWPLEWSLMPGYGEDLAWEWFFVAEEPGSNQPAPEDARALNGIERKLEGSAPRLTLANLKEVDRKGHYGDPGQYEESVASLDDPLVDLWNTMQGFEDSTMPENTVWVITSDHGRHRLQEDDEPWRNHGDDETADRQVPLILVGPGIAAGQIVEGPYGLDDVAPTVAALMGIELPWARGLVIEEALENGHGFPVRSGAAGIASSGGFVVEASYDSDPYARSEIGWSGGKLSADEAWAAEAPAVVAVGDGALACWREIELALDYMPWTARCAELGSGAIAAPEEKVSHFWRPRLLEVDGEAWAVYANNPDDIAELGNEQIVGVRLARWDGDAWTVKSDAEPFVRYPTDPDAAAIGDAYLVAFAGSSAGNEGREQRRIYLQPGDWDTGHRPAVQLDLDAAAPAGDTWRFEKPRMRVDGDVVELTALGIGETERNIVRISSMDGGETWGTPSVVHASASLYTHQAPFWVGDEVAWVSAVADRAEICRAEDCLVLPTNLVEDVSWDGDTLRAVVGGPTGAWTLQEAQPAGWLE